ncbi:hypothetical protein B0T19DRAFT_273179 [Cercophora scortea]|uniref:HNH domain-containing protein n=1 Tax=Cercophora scortea TaxID=314031 RepID=A0AAE0I7G4_9PEZI|nr:hypothetical protein B0T19DRAFT_273179 [Cercophora scortea]
MSQSKSQSRDHEESAETNYEHFRDCLSSVLIERLTSKPPSPRLGRRAAKQASKKNSSSSELPQANNDTSLDTDDNNTAASAEELSDFIDYIARSIFTTLPTQLQNLTYRTLIESPLTPTYQPPYTSTSTSALLTTLDPSITDSLEAYSILTPSESTTIESLLSPVLTTYFTLCTTPPPAPSSTKATTTACELCGRDWINLTYHHLIPRMVHAKTVKRGWHRADELQNVAWLCGACHRFVHRFAGHEDLARRYYTVELLLEQREVAAFADWVGRLRWKGR